MKMNVYISGETKEITLTQRDFVYSGGEGEVYIIGDTAFKIYHPGKSVIDPAKVKELSSITMNNVITPKKMLKNKKGEYIGYTMSALNKTVPLSRLITSEYQKNNNISNVDILNIISRMRETISHIHSKDCLIIDGNELNYLISEDHKEIYFIDVDSYQSKSFQGNAYSPSTLDPQIDIKKGNFTKQSDWFAFAIISCNLLIGVHPFKGTYKGTKHTFKRGDFASRMAANISIFNNDVSVSSAVRSFDLIPPNYRSWFIELFENNQRIEAPDYIEHNSYKSPNKVIVQPKKLTLTKIFESKDFEIDNIYSHEHEVFFKTETEIHSTEKTILFKNKKTHMVLSSISNSPILIKLSKNELKYYNTETKENGSLNIEGNNVFIYQNRIYLVTNDYLAEIILFESSKTTKLMISQKWSIMPLATQQFENVLHQNIMGGTYFMIPFASGNCAQIHIKELDHKKIINAKYESNVLILISYENGNYFRYIYKLNNSHNKYLLINRELTDQLIINFTCLANGIVIFIPEDGQVHVFQNLIEKTSINKINDKEVKICYKLYSNGTQAMIQHNKSVYNIKLI